MPLWRFPADSGLIELLSPNGDNREGEPGSACSSAELPALCGFAALLLHFSPFRFGRGLT